MFEFCWNQTELAAILAKQERESDYDQLSHIKEAAELLKVSMVTISKYKILSRKETAELLKISLVTLSNYKREGRLPFYSLGNRVYFKKGDIMEAIEAHMKYKHWRFNV